MMKKYSACTQFFLRMSIGIGFIVPALDRFGVWGVNGAAGITWGDWQHFSVYAHKLMYFLPDALAEVLAVISSIAELAFGLLLIIGLYTRWISICSGLLLLSFAICMSLALSIHAPLNYGVFTISAASFLLSTIPKYRWSIDALLKNKKDNLESTTIELIF